MVKIFAQILNFILALGVLLYAFYAALRFIFRDRGPLQKVAHFGQAEARAGVTNYLVMHTTQCAQLNLKMATLDRIHSVCDSVAQQSFRTRTVSDYPRSEPLVLIIKFEPVGPRRCGQHGMPQTVWKYYDLFLTVMSHLFLHAWSREAVVT